MTDRWPAWQLGYMSGLSGDEEAQAPYPRTPDTVERIRWWQDGHFVGLHDYRKAQGKPLDQVVKHPCPQCGLLFTPGSALASHLRSHPPEPEEGSVAAWKKQEVDRARPH
jgi:hypothetical protein